MLVTADRETRIALETAAEDSGLVHSTRVLADARFAFENLWDRVRPGEVALPDILIVDARLPGMPATQLTRYIRQSEPMRDLFVAAYAPGVSPWELDELENAGIDFVIRTPEVPGNARRLFRALAQRQAAKHAPVNLCATRLCVGTLEGSGLDVPAF